MQVEKSDLSSHCKSCQWDEFHYRFPSAFLPWMTHLFFDRPILPPLFFFQCRSTRERTGLWWGEIESSIMLCAKEGITLNFALHVFAFQEGFCVLSKVVYVIVWVVDLNNHFLSLCLHRLMLHMYHQTSSNLFSLFLFTVFVSLWSGMI